MTKATQAAPSPVIVEATQRQRLASDPFVSSWVGASAGSGKTKVLTDRILRLLLPREDGRPGTPPQKILALTFTKAAANEMALRLSRKLSAWAVMEESKLAGEMEKDLLGRPPTSGEIEAARKLFARVVDTPGGLNIMTIHSFCQSVLGRFPIEAGLPPSFRPLEEEEASNLLEEARRETLLYADAHRGSPLHGAVAQISTLLNEDQFEELLKAMIGERAQMDSILKSTFGTEGLYTRICAYLGIRPGLTAEEALADFCTEQAEAALRPVCPPLAAGKPTDRKKATAIQDFWDADIIRRPSLYGPYYKTFISAKGEIKDAATKGVLDSHPDIKAVLLDEAERLLAFEETKKAIRCSETTKNLFVLGQDVLERFQQAKDVRGAVDFDDLILRTLSLLKGELKSLSKIDTRTVTPWILYKLDDGLDHILVDEAQDTNPEQWEIIRALSDDFFSGQGAAEDVRTLFVVGDKKQSIFSFQRAAPKKFDDMHDWFDKKIRESGNRFLLVDINTSFRSVRTVLDAVDAVFDPARRLLADYPPHIAKREGQPGLVEFWPLYQTQTVGDDAPEDEDDNRTATPAAGWTIPDRLLESESGSQKMANKIGDTIKKWLNPEKPEILETYGRPVEAGDILVLVRSRNAFVGQLVRALKTRDIPVSGVDRMVLGEQLVVQDLVAAAKFALLPDDDLTLACLLKSPFIGMGEEELYALAQRTDTLWNSVKKNGDGLIYDWVRQLIERAGTLPPYEFFSRLVQERCPADERGGIHAIRTRLGDDALDPLDEFLNLALTYEEGHSAGLQGFIHAQEQGSSEIKRQLEEGSGAVRIMTVHGAKGLQAPIVFLPDTVRTKASEPDRILWPYKTGLKVPLYRAAQSGLPKAATGARQTVERDMDEEYRRLLYVAMTRAEERLYIGGYVNKKRPKQGGSIAYWYEDIRSALETHPAIERVPSGILDQDGKDTPVLRLRAEAADAPDKTDRNKTDKAAVEATLPSWAFSPAPAEPFPPRPLAPSRPSEAEPAALSPLSAAQDYRFQRGNITHKLIQILPDLPPAARRSAAEKFLARTAPGLPPALQKSIAEEVMAILDDETFGAIFGAGSMAEVPVTGLLHGNMLVSGQIDRLLITDEEILIVDFKTNRPPPQTAADVPAMYVRQLKIYADTLRVIYPAHKIRTALLWTDGARLMEITF